MDSRTSKLAWPAGKRFAFTVFDDTDGATTANTRPVYDLLLSLGFRTTKSVWPLAATAPPVATDGATCADPEYADWARELQRAGAEIAYHGATYHTSPRRDTMRALERFFELFGHYPSSMANHAGCADAIYWGAARLTGMQRIIYNAVTRFANDARSRGHVPHDELFWGDICLTRVSYVRNFVFADVNTLRACPFMPYHDRNRPFVKYWFASSEGGSLPRFNETLSERNQDRLEADCGACIMYTHFADGFYANGHINRRFEALMKRLSRMNGWFVPVSTLLDYILEKRGAHVLTRRERARLERRWLLHKLRVGPT